MPTDVEVVEPDLIGRWVGTVATLAMIGSMMDSYRTTGECLAGTYAWVSDLLLVRDDSEATAFDSIFSLARPARSTSVSSGSSPTPVREVLNHRESGRIVEPARLDRTAEPAQRWVGMRMSTTMMSPLRSSRRRAMGATAARIEKMRVPSPRSMRRDQAAWASMAAWWRSR